MDSPKPEDVPPDNLLQDLVIRPPLSLTDNIDQHSALQSYVAALLESGRNRAAISLSSSESDTTHANTQIEEKPKHYYKFWIGKKKYFKIFCDRLQLLALLDR